jgi:hypothetical protein
MCGVVATALRRRATAGKTPERLDTARRRQRF